MKLSQIARSIAQLQGEVCVQSVGADPEIERVAAVETAIAGDLSFVDGNNRFARWVEKTQASALILSLKAPELQARADARGLAWLAVPEPRLAFAQAIALFYQPYQPEPQIHPTAVIDPSVQLGPEVSIGAHVVIQKNCVIGQGVTIHPNVVVYPGVRLGNGTVLHSNCTIQERSQIGANCVIQCGAVVGGEGFGFVPLPDGWFKMEQSGHVVLEDGVEIGCNSTVDRPAVGETRIRRNTKLDNLVHVGHGCSLGKNGAIAAQTGLAGGVSLGDRHILAGQVGISNRVAVGDNVTISSKAGLHSDVESGSVVSGYPAMPHKIWLRSALLQRKLPEIYSGLRKLLREHEAESREGQRDVPLS